MSVQELASIEREKSQYEKERTYQIIINKCVLKEMELDILAKAAVSNESNKGCRPMPR